MNAYKHTDIKHIALLAATVATALACALALAFAAPATAHAAQKQTCSWARLAGDNALGTMKKIVEEGWSASGSETVVIATSDGYWDALSANALAGALGCPVLLTDSRWLSGETSEAIQCVQKAVGNVKTAYIVGGTSAVAENAAQSLRDVRIGVVRIGGANAVETAALVADEARSLGASSSTCVVATVDGYWDALAASPYAYWSGSPIYLTSGSSLDATAASAIARGGYSHAIVMGGGAALSSTVSDQLQSLGLSVERLAGDNAIETSKAAAARFVELGMSTSDAGVATVDGYWDALCGAALCGSKSAPLVLASDANTSAAALFSANVPNVSRAYVFGGTAAVSEAAYSAFERSTYLDCNPDNVYTVEFRNWDGSLIHSEQVAEGDMPACDLHYMCERTYVDYDGFTRTYRFCPQREDGSYAFTGWDREVTPATCDAVYVAQYKEEYNDMYDKYGEPDQPWPTAAEVMDAYNSRNSSRAYISKDNPACTGKTCWEVLASFDATGHMNLLDNWRWSAFSDAIAANYRNNMTDVMRIIDLNGIWQQDDIKGEIKSAEIKYIGICTYE